MQGGSPGQSLSSVPSSLQSNRRDQLALKFSSRNDRAKHRGGRSRTLSRTTGGSRDVCLPSSLPPSLPALRASAEKPQQSTAFSRGHVSAHHAFTGETLVRSSFLRSRPKKERLLREAREEGRAHAKVEWKTDKARSSYDRRICLSSRVKKRRRVRDTEEKGTYGDGCFSARQKATD